MDDTNVDISELGQDTTVDINALGQVIDTTWGRSSTPLTASCSVKLQLVGAGVLQVKYNVIVNFGSERQMIETRRSYEAESMGIINATIKTVKARYKDLTGSTLKTKEISSDDTLDIINMNFVNPKRTAYYRRVTTFEVA